MKCSFCGLEFESCGEKKGCQGCSIFSQCGKIKCPRCGYMVVPEPAWIKKIKSFIERKKRK
ncbi:MAG: hypothetical protein P9L90_06825 [Candidatus Aadella gelida]|nr:hypothetical protein [Candidatus Aadella gelida]